MFNSFDVHDFFTELEDLALFSPLNSIKILHILITIENAPFEIYKAKIGQWRHSCGPCEQIC